MGIGALDWLVVAIYFGMVIAIAALMSSLSSGFNCRSTLITLNIYRKLRPRASERRLVLVSQLATVVMVSISTLFFD